MTSQMDGLSPDIEQLEKEQERADERALFARYQADPSPAHEELLVEKFRPLVYRIVHRFRYNADQFEDLVQVGTVGLVLAIRRFETDRNFRFSTYAWQTIQGEIQRYFRDKTWAVSVPRDLKERSLKVFNTANELTHKNGSEPTVAEIAKHSGLNEEQVLEAMELGSAYHPQSFLDTVRESDVSYALGDEGSAEDSYDMTATKKSIFWESILAHLGEAEAQIIRMYFFDQRTQKEIADKLETSQMNVSRIMRRALLKLRKLAAPSDFENLGTL
jgi:RNA polymerase sigma-B factor